MPARGPATVLHQCPKPTATLTNILLRFLTPGGFLLTSTFLPKVIGSSQAFSNSDALQGVVVVVVVVTQLPIQTFQVSCNPFCRLYRGDKKKTSKAKSPNLK